MARLSPWSFLRTSAGGSSTSLRVPRSSFVSSPFSSFPGFVPMSFLPPGIVPLNRWIPEHQLLHPNVRHEQRVLLPRHQLAFEQDERSPPKGSNLASRVPIVDVYPDDGRVVVLPEGRLLDGRIRRRGYVVGEQEERTIIRIFPPDLSPH